MQQSAEDIYILNEAVVVDLDDEANAEELAAADEVTHGWSHYVKIAFIALKVGLVCFLLTKASIAYYRKDKALTLIHILLPLWIIILIGLLLFDFGTQYIAAFYLMTFFSNYLNFFGMNMLLRNIPSKESETLRSKTNVYWYVMNGLYVLVFVLSIVFLDRLGPKCKKDKIYPACLNFCSILFIINSIFHFIIHKKGYWLNWEGENQTLLPQEEGAKVRFRVTKDVMLVKPIF